MARGVEGKLRKRNEKKEARLAAASNEIEEDEDADNGLANNFGDKMDSYNNDKPRPRSKKRANNTNGTNKDIEMAPTAGGGGIKLMPLILLLILTGSTVIPGLIYAGGFMGNMIQKHHIMGSLGHRLGIGPSPKKRLVSFYEKHDPEKIDDVPKILSKYYGDYPKLVKRLERKYHDYGYFLSWEQDESASKFAKEMFADTSEKVVQLWANYSPRVLKNAARNAKYNLSFLYKKGRKFWRKNLWPILEPIFGVPGGVEEQKRKDRSASRDGKKKGKEKS